MALMPLRCLIVEDQVMFLQLLQGVLQRLAYLEVVATATSCREGQLACRVHQPDLLILDLALPDGHGIRVLQSLAQHCPAARAVVLSAEAAGFVCPEALQPLLLGVVDKTATYDALVSVIHELVPQAQQGGAESDQLTPRQQAIFAQIGQGLQNKEIARCLGLSVATVETHRKAIARRLGQSGAELVRTAALHAQG